MAVGIFRIRLDDGSHVLARGDAEGGPKELLPSELTIDRMLSGGGPGLRDAVAMPSAGDVLPRTRVVAPIESQEVWAAGVTYLRSRDARAEESTDATPYDLVYTAERPELFFKSPGWRVRGPGDDIAIRADSAWNTPEPELTLALDERMEVVGYTIGNDVSSRSIEGENPLYLPQAKVYDGSCALGPCIVPAGPVEPPFAITLEVARAGDIAFRGATTTELMTRRFDELASYLGRALAFPTGAFLLTGTALVPDAPFSLSDGDLTRIAIEGLGVLENPVTTVGVADRTSAAERTTP